MKTEIENAVIEMYIECHLYKIDVEKAIMYIDNETGELLSFHAQLATKCKLADMIQFANNSRMELSINPGNKTMFLHSFGWQKLELISIRPKQVQIP